MARTPTTVSSGIRVSPAVVIETTQLVRQSHDALKCINHLLARTGDGVTVEASDLICLLLPIQERMYGALDELEAVCRGSCHED